MKRNTGKKNLISFQLLFVLEDSCIDRFLLTQLRQPVLVIFKPETRAVFIFLGFANTAQTR